MILDIKIGKNVRRKKRIVAGGHAIETPTLCTYSSIVSRDSVRIALTIATLNDLKVLSIDMQNKFITAKNRENR